MSKRYWWLVHRLPCPLQHLLCSQCREHGCGECLIRAFVRSEEVSLTTGPPLTGTYATGTSYRFTFTGEHGPELFAPDDVQREFGIDPIDGP